MGNKPDVVEYYDRKKDQLICRIESSIVPLEGQKISVRGVTWAVVKVTYAIDHADKYEERQARANVELEYA